MLFTMAIMVLIRPEEVIAALLLPSTLWAEDNEPIDITFSASGEATTVESVTVRNLTHTDIEAVTLNGTDILRLTPVGTSSFRATPR